jgi:dihydrofolate reductase
MARPKLYHIVAVAENNVIGKDGKLPWHFSSDLKYFKQTTMQSTLIMGRKTFESIGGKPLPGRPNFVLSRKPKNQTGVSFFESIEKALEQVVTEKAFIIGGGEIFKQTQNQVDGIYLTKIDRKYEGDAFYPNIPNAYQQQSSKVLQENPKIEVRLYEKS